MVSRVIGKETTCVLQLLAGLSISTTCNGIASSDDIRTTRLTCASSWSSGDLTGWARSMSKLWRDTCRSGKAQVHNEGGHREEQTMLDVKRWLHVSQHAAAVVGERRSRQAGKGAGPGSK